MAMSRDNCNRQKMKRTKRENAAYASSMQATAAAQSDVAKECLHQLSNTLTKRSPSVMAMVMVLLR